MSNAVKESKDSRTVLSASEEVRRLREMYLPNEAKAEDYPSTDRPAKGSADRPIQFNFEENWGLILPHLDKPSVDDAVDSEMCKYVDEVNACNREDGENYRYGWERGDCPSSFIELRCDRYKRKSLEWYAQMPAQCAALFVSELAKLLYPEESWFVVTGELAGCLHTIVTNADRSIVFDFERLRACSARQSLLLVGDSPRNSIERTYVEFTKQRAVVAPWRLSFTDPDRARLDAEAEEIASRIDQLRSQMLDAERGEGEKA